MVWSRAGVVSLSLFLYLCLPVPHFLFLYVPCVFLYSCVPVGLKEGKSEREKERMFEEEEGVEEE